jgi:hypothetical protein
MDIDSNGDISIIWHHCYVGKDVPPESDVVLMTKKRMGTFPQNYQNISRHRIGPSICPALAVKDGRMYAVWMEGEAPRRTYFSQKIGGGWSTPIHLSDTPCYYLEMDTDASGNIHIVAGSKNGNFYYKSRIGGQWKPVEIISSGNAPRQHGDIKCKDNVAVAVWTQGPQGRWSVYASAKMLGDNWALPVKIGDAHGGEYGNKHVRVAIDDKNTAHFVWESIGVGGTYDIFYEKYSADVPEDATFIEVDNSFLSFQTDDNTSNPAPQTFRVRASGADSINYTVSKDKGWTSVSPMQGSSTGGWVTHTVSVDASGKNDGSYYGTITITDPNAYNNPMEIGVLLTVGEEINPPPSPPTSSSGLQVDRTNLAFSTEEGKNPPAQSLNVRTTGGGSLSYTASTNKPWLSVSPNNGTVGSGWSPLSVSVNAQDRRPGTYQGRVQISASGNSKATVSVTLVIEKKNTPQIEIDKSRLYFWGYAHDGPLPPKTFRIRNSGSKTLNYKITSNKGWVKRTPKQGSSTREWDTISITVDSSSLEVNKHKATIQITAAGADNSPQNISIEFEVVHPPQAYPPLDVSVKRLNHEGLMIQEYKSQIDWKPNPKNQGLFEIVKYRIYRKNKSQTYSSYVYLADVAADVLTFYDGGFSSKQERNKHIYSVACVDSTGKEGIRTEFLAVDDAPDSLLTEKQIQKSKKFSEMKKIP